MNAIVGKALLASALLLAVPLHAAAASANPATVNFGNVPLNTTVSRTVTITVDAGFNLAIASGTGLNAPFSFDFSVCGTGGGFTGPGTCTVIERFTPTAIAASSGTTNVFECPVAGGTCVPIPFAVNGTGVSAAAANPPSVAFGSVPINTTVTQAVTLTVDAGYRTEIASGTGLNAPFAFDFSTCGTGGGFSGPGTCTVNQRFTPTAAVASSGTTNVFECPVAGGTCIPIPYTVSGTGVITAAAAPPSIAFGNVPINTTAMQTITLTVDAGYRTEIASGTGLNAPFAFDFSSCGAGGGFTGPGTCTVTQRFTPTATVASSGTTNVFECPVAGGTCIPIPYTMSGTGGSVAAASPTSIAFGNVPINTTVTVPVTISVDAGYRTEIASGSGINVPFSFGFNTCGAGGGFTGPGTCVVNQSFTPTAAVASSGTTNVFECPVGGGSCIPIPYSVSGTGVTNASANPASLDFGNVPINTTVTLPVTITVDAGYRTQIASGTGINAPFSFGFNTCGAGGGFTGPGTCVVNQSFSPTAAIASSGVTNVFECPVGGGSCIPIPYSVSGTGVTNASANPASLDFGNVPINTTVTLPVTITVDAGYRTQIASGTGINAPFSFGFNTCGAGGGFTGPGTCVVNQSFTPTAAVASSGTTNVFECPVGGGSCIPIPYSVSGTGVTNASANPASLDFGNVPINTTVTLPVTITVDAGYRTQIASGTGINAPFSFGFNTCGAGGGFTGPGTCVVNQSFTPTAAVASSGTTNVFECPVGGGSCIPIPYSVSGTGVTNASANPASLDFGNVPINTTVTLPVTITVDAGYRTQIASGTGINAPFSFGFNTCGAGGGFTGPGTCVVNQSFTPTAAIASSGVTNVFECPVGGGSCIPIPYSVSGTGVTAHAVSPTSINFGTLPLGTTATQVVTVTVDGGYRVSLTPGGGPTPPFSVDFNTCAAGGGFTGPGTCTVRESFTPNAIGPVSGTLTISECPVSGGGSCLGSDVALTGAGVSNRGASPASLNFGGVNLNTTVSQPITLTIDAGYRVSLTTGGGPNPPFGVNLGTCGAGGGFTGPGTCAVSETFKPNAVGLLAGSLSVSECPVAGGGTCLPIDVPLSGIGVSTRAANPASVNFGNVVVNRTVSRTIALTVDTGYRISRTGSGVGLPFSVDFNTCGTGAGFAGPGTCAVKESFTPTAAGPASGTLTVLECPIAGGGSCLGIDVPSSGTGIATLIITTTTLPNGILDSPYPATTLQTIGGVPPIAWSIVDGRLPRGLTLNPATGTISGTPTAPHDHGHDRDRHDSCDGDGHDHWGHDRHDRDRDDCDARDGTGDFTFTVAATDKSDPSRQIATKKLTITVLGKADLALSIAAPSPVQNTKLVTYTITVRNLGPDDGEAIVTDVLPATTHFVSVDTSQGHCSTPRVGFAGTVSCALHSIDDGDRATIKITVDPTIKTGSISNTASVAVTGDAIDPVSTNNTATVTVQIK